MKIVISQREILHKNSMGHLMHLDALERSWFTFLKNHTVIPYPNTTNIPDNIDFDCLIISGGPDSIARHHTENALFRLAERINKPVIGVCHGAFAVNDLTAGINGTVDGHEASLHNIIMDGATYLVNSHHHQSIQTLGPDMRVVATDEDGNIEAFQHVSRPIYGIVWHPERMSMPVLPKDVEQLLL
jgi:putative glutamine amidotransferase